MNMCRSEKPSTSALCAYNFKSDPAVEPSCSSDGLGDILEYRQVTMKEDLHHRLLQLKRRKKLKSFENVPVSPDLFEDSDDVITEHQRSRCPKHAASFVKKTAATLLKSPVLRYSQMPTFKNGNRRRLHNNFSCVANPMKKRLMEIKLRNKKLAEKNKMLAAKRHTKWLEKFNDGIADLSASSCGASLSKNLDRSIGRRKKPYNLTGKEIKYLVKKNFKALQAIQCGEIESDRHRRFHGGLKLKSSLYVLPHPMYFFYEEQENLVGELIRQLFKENDDWTSKYCVDYNEQVLKPEALTLLMGRVLKWSREETLVHLDKHWLDSVHHAPGRPHRLFSL